MSIVASLFPDSVVVVDGPISEFQGDLHPGEQALVRKAVDKRIREFTAGRTCARIAIEKLGVANQQPILSDEKRAPIWPEDVVGTITHTDDDIAVAVARSDDVESLGLDIEKTDRVHKELWKQLFTPTEIHYLTSLPNEQQLAYAALFFSAKECFYKFQYPLTRQWVDFKQAEVVLNSNDKSSFKLTLLEHVDKRFTKGKILRGSYRFYKDKVVTSIH